METHSCCCHTCQVSSHTLRVKGRTSYQVSLHLLPQGGELSKAELPVPAVLLNSWGSCLTCSFVTHLLHLYRVRTSLTGTDWRAATNIWTLKDPHESLYVYYLYFYLTLCISAAAQRSIRMNKVRSLLHDLLLVLKNPHFQNLPVDTEQNRTGPQTELGSDCGAPGS